MFTLCTICARGGSKGLPGKNLRLLAGQPLIAHTIAHALRAGGLDRVIVSTDSPEIANVARREGAEVPFQRPVSLATDAAGKADVLRHAVEFVEEQEGRRVDVLVDLQPTSPLREPGDIAACRLLLDARSDADVVVSVCISPHNPYYSLYEVKNGRAVISKQASPPLKRRQDAPPVYALNGSIYVYRRRALAAGRGLLDGCVLLYEMPPQRSIDIDDELDLKLAELLVKEKAGESQAL